MMKKITFRESEKNRSNKTNRWLGWLSLCVMILMGSTGLAQTIQLGSGTATNSYLPMYYLYEKNYTQTIYTAAEIIAAGAEPTGGTITKIRYKPTASQSTIDWRDWVIYMGNTTKTSFTSTTDWVPVASLAQVFNSQIPANVVANTWMEITLATPFVWDGTNIVVAIAENTPDWSNNPSWAAYTLAPTTGSKAIYKYQDGANINPSSPPTATNVTNVAAQIQFDGSLMSACTGTPNAGSAVLTPGGGNSGSTFMANATGVTSASGLAFQWQKFVGGVWTDIAGATSKNSQITAETGAVGSTTDYRVQVTCTASGLSAFSTPATYTIQLVYCTPLYSSGCQYGARVNNVITTSAITNINNTNSACGSTTAPIGYSNYYDTHQMSAGRGTAFDIEVGVSNYSGGVKVWIDYNQNGTFEASELVTASTATIASGSSHLGSITIPPTALVGDTRMRVRVVESSTNFDACSSYSYGETEDYKISILQLDNCTGTPTAGTVTSPLYACANTSFTLTTLGATAPADGLEGIWQSSPAGMNDWVDVVGAISTTHVMSAGVTSNTDFRYKLTCTNSNETDISGTISVLMNDAIDCYCIPAGTSITNYITGFTTSGGTVNISNVDNGLSAGGYGDFFLFHNLTQEIGDSVDFEVTTFGTATSGLKIWVDWNQNGSFEDDGELVYATNAYANIHTGSFTVSNDALAGQTRMRIGNSNTPNTGPATPCMTNLSGEYEDYMLTVYVPDCAKPFDIALDAVTVDSATISWTSAGALFDVEFGEEGFFQSGVPTATGVTNPYTITNLDPLTTYEFYIRQDCGVDGFSNWAGPFRFTTECLPPNITGTTPGEVCGEGEVTLSATADGGTIAWYANETGGTKLSEGASFTTPVLTETTSYWVETFEGINGLGGRLEPNYTSGSYTTASDYGLVFTATESFILNTVDVYLVGSAGNLVVNLTTNTGTILDTRTIALPALGTTTTPAQHTINLDFEIEPGEYRLIAQSSPNMVRESSAGGYPYAVGDVASITSGYIGGTTFTTYYYFYNWIYNNGCGSPRTEVIATVTDAPDFELSQTTLEICEGDTSDAVTITTGASDYDTFEWTPSLGVSGDATTGWSFDPTETTTYVLTTSQSAGAECMATVEVQVNVNPLPTAITVVASETEVCDDAIVALSVTGNINNGIAVLGDGTTAPSTTTYPNPLSAWFGGTKHQMLYTAAELSAQGMMAGSEITEVTLDLATVTGGACVDFTIRMGATTLNVMSSGFVAGTTTVYGPATFTPATAGVGLASFTLTTPYLWDGVSNLIVETIHNAGNSGNGSGTTTRATTTATNSVAYVRADNITGGIAGFDALTTTPTYAAQRPNMTFTYTLEQTNITWSPATNLYTDAAATTAYVADDYATTVYFKGDTAGTVTYTATSHTDEGCSVSDSVELTVNQTPDAPVATSPQLMAEGQTIADIIVTGDNLTWYTDEDLTDEVDASTVLTEGTYTFYVTDSMGDCTSEATMITVEVSLSTIGFDTASFKAYPNPVKDYFNISYSKDIQNIAVINMLGQTIFTKNVNATDTQIDMTSLPTGTYFVKVNVDGAVKTIKVVKQ